MDNFLVSVIIPVFNEQENIGPLMARLLTVLKKYQYEIIFVNDGSTDKTSQTIKKIAEKNRQIKLISFFRNFGHQMALSAGYELSRGEAVVSIDADLQDPPEIIDEMIKKWLEGAKIVYAKRKERRGESFFKLGTATVFYKLINFLSDTPIPNEVGDFRLIDKQVVVYLNGLKEKPNFLRGLVAWPGFPTEYVYFTRDRRSFGETHYGFFKMLNFALEGIMSFSTKPLRLATYFGFISAGLGFIGIVYEIIKRFLYPESFVTGWIGIFVAVIFLGGIQLLTIGIIGEYIGKIYKEIQSRPKFLIKEKVNL